MDCRIGILQPIFLTSHFWLHPKKNKAFFFTIYKFFNNLPHLRTLHTIFHNILSAKRSAIFFSGVFASHKSAPFFYIVKKPIYAEIFFACKKKNGLNRFWGIDCKEKWLVFYGVRDFWIFLCRRAFFRLFFLQIYTFVAQGTQKVTMYTINRIFLHAAKFTL